MRSGEKERGSDTISQHLYVYSTAAYTILLKATFYTALQKGGLQKRGIFGNVSIALTPQPKINMGHHHNGRMPNGMFFVSMSLPRWYNNTYSQKEKFPQFTRPDGLIDKNPCKNAT